MSKWLAAAMSIMLTAGAALPEGSGCRSGGPETLLASASLPTTKAVVEYTYLASNPLPWGKSALVATRVWGSGVVERWMVSDRRWASCPDTPVAASGSAVYLFVGSGAVEVLADTPVSGTEAAALKVEFSTPRHYPISSVDRVMAWLRVFPELILGGSLVAGLGALAVVRRRRRKRERYLF